MKTFHAKKRRISFTCEFGSIALTAQDLQKLLGISKAEAYRKIRTGVISKQQRQMIKVQLYGNLHGWPGWLFWDGKLISPWGQHFTPEDLSNLDHYRSILAS